MERKQRELDKERAWCQQEYEYVLWKISIVHHARDDEMDTWEKRVFKYTFIDGLDYRGIKRVHPTAVHNPQIARALRSLLQAIINEIEAQSAFDESGNMGRLRKEIHDGTKKN